MKAIPADVVQVLDELSDRIPTILGDSVYGIYAYGSITQGAFDAARSDVDCVVLVRSGITSVQYDTLDRWLSTAATNQSWFARLHVSILVKDELFTMNGQGWLYQFGALKRSGSDGNPLIWLNILETGIVLWGPPPQSFVPSITREMIVQALDRELGYLREEIVDNASQKWRELPFYRAYAVLTICRILYTLGTGRIGSKPEAATWTLRNVSEAWHPIISQALEFSRGQHQTQIGLQPIADFIRFAENRLALRSASAGQA